MSSSRRRKPLVTRKVLSDEEDDVTTNDDDSQMTNGHNEGKDKDEDIPEDLPEGTVVVEPEPVEDNAYKGPDFSSNKKKVLEASGYLSSVFCTSCGEQINTSKKGDARKHPELSVLVCRRCYKFHQSGEIKQDEDGVDEYCRWCSEGGKIYGCDFCHNAFCQACIKRNLGRAEVTRVKDGDKFKCYICNPKPLTTLVEQCNSVMDQIDKELERLNESFKKKKEANKGESKEKSKDDEKNKTSLVIKLPNVGGKQYKTSTPKSKESVVATNATSRMSVVSQPVNPVRLAPLSSGNINVIRHEGVSVAPRTSLQPQKVIYVEPNRGSAKQLVYVQPKPNPVSSLAPREVIQKREPLVWNNVTPHNVPYVADQLIQSTNDLINVLRSVRVNVQGTGHSLSQIAIDGRKTAISIMKSSVDLFLTQLSDVVGTNIVQEGQSQSKKEQICEPIKSSKFEGVKLTGGNSSVISTGEKDLIVLDSETESGNQSKVEEVLDITDSSEKNSNSDDKEEKSENTDMEMYLVPMEQDEEEKSKEELKCKKEDTTEQGEVVKGDKFNKKKDESNTEDNEKDETDDENDAAHLELLQELQELSGTVEVKDDDKNDSEKAEDRDRKDIRSSEMKEEKNVDKSVKKETISDKKDNSLLEKKGKGNNKDEISVSKERNVDISESSGSESDVEDNSDSDNSDDSDFGVKKTRRTRTSNKKAAEKEKFKELRSRRQDREKSAKKKAEKEKEEKLRKSKGKEKKKCSDDSDDFDEDLEKEIENLEKKPVLKKESKKEEKKKDNYKKKKDQKSKKESEKKDKSKKGKKKDDLDDLSSTEEDNKDEAEENNYEEEDVPMDQQDDDEATEDLSDEDEADNAGMETDSSDSEIILSPRKRREAAEKKKKKEKKDNSDSDTVDEDVKPKKRLRSSLLESKISDSESDFQPLKKRQKGKKKAESSAEKSESSSDSESEFIALGKKSKGKGGKNKKKKDGTGKKRKRIKKMDSSDDDGDKTEADSDELEDMKQKKKRRKKKGSDDSENEKEGENDNEDGSPNKGRKDIRKLIKGKKLAATTKAAAKAEEERRARIAEKQKKYNNIIQEVDESSPTKAPVTKQLILERDEKTKESTLEVDKDLIVKLKPHQVEAVDFMWNCTVESLKMLKEDESEGAGCILAHCMGLGKTLSVISFLHTMLGNYDTTGFSTALIVCPLNTVLNWQNEVNMWLEDNECKLKVFELASVKVNETRAKLLKEWQEGGGIMIIGYEMFRNLSQGNNCRSKKLKTIFKKTLVDPGPDFVVCDEGHILKNDASALSKAMNQIKTRRRIVLTGTPLQNNLAEYHCMVSFVKPNLLGTRKEFGNQFVNPIVNGQHTDSSSHDVRLMKRRAHILHEKLAGCVQRKDYSALTKYLPPKHEYVISVRLAPVQCDLYSKYLELGGYGEGDMVRSKGAKLFSDYQALMRIWTHPWVLKLDEIRQENKNMIDDEDSFIDDSEETSESEAKTSSSESDDELSVSGSDDNKSKKRNKQKDKEEGPKESFAGEIVKKWKTRSRGEFNDGDFSAEEEEVKPFSTGWWADYVKEEDQFKMELGSKLVLLFEILRMCEEIGDKVLVFSQSLLSLDIIESYLEHVDNEYNEELNKKYDDSKKEKTDGKVKDENSESKDKSEEVFGKVWLKGQDYLRMDGSTGAPLRAEMAKNFNDPENYRLRLFLISTKAGGLGINLFAANRVIIFDASWNPSHDVQSIFRVYRFGQEKPVYVYRFLAQGTMEEKIYERQVTKQSLSQRVIDEHQIDRHFDSNDLRELYIFKPDRLDDPNRTERPTPALPKDTLLAELLTEQKKWIVGYHEHDSLLENKIDQELSEEERKAAWEEFENERKGLISTVQQRFNNFGMHGGMPQSFQFGFNHAMGGMNMNSHLNQENLLRIVQEMRQKFPHLPQEQLTMQVQNVVRNMISRQLQQQQWEQRRQLEQRELQQRQQLQQLQARIMMQQNEIRMQSQQQSSRQGTSMGSFPGSALLANALTKGPHENQKKKS